MKKVVLAATTALVAAGSAAALEVTLGGQISTAVSYAGATNAWSGPAIGTDPDDGVSLSVSGESMGWTYGGSVNLLDGSYGDVTLGSAGLGSLTLSTNSIEWSGMDLGGFAVSVSANPADLQTSAKVGLVGSLGGMSVDASVTNDADRTFTAKIGTAVGGASVAIEANGGLSDTSTVTYSMDLGLSAMGSDLTIGLDGSGGISVEAAMGALTLTTSLSDGDAFEAMTLAYSAELAEGLQLDASVSSDGTDTNMSIGTTLSF